MTQAITDLKTQFSITLSTTTSSFLFDMPDIAGVGVNITLFFLNSSIAGMTSLSLSPERTPEEGPLLLVSSAMLHSRMEKVTRKFCVITRQSYRSSSKMEIVVNTVKRKQAKSANSEDAKKPFVARSALDVQKLQLEKLMKDPVGVLSAVFYLLYYTLIYIQ